MSSKTTPRIHRTPEQWQALVDQFEQSSLTQRAFCQRKGLAYGTFARWRRRLLSDNTSNDDQNSQVFVELLKGDTQPFEKLPWDVELQLGDGVTLRLRRQPC